MAHLVFMRQDIQRRRVGGGGVPPVGHEGINFVTNNVTAPYFRLDLGSSAFASSNLAWIAADDVGGATMVRAPACNYSPTGGPFGRGYNRFIPGGYSVTVDNPRGEHYCGIGQILGLPLLSPDPTKFTLGMTVRLGSGWFTEGDGNKEVVILRSAGDRPMIIPKIGSSTTILAACDGTVCNCNADLMPREYGNDSNTVPDQELLYGRWQYVEMQMDTAAPGAIYVKVWDEDQVYAGEYIYSDMNEGAGGELEGIDIINFVSQVTSPTAACYKDIALVEGWLGSATNRGPPPGFPGSTR